MSQNGDEQPTPPDEPVKQYRASSRPSLRGNRAASGPHDSATDHTSQANDHAATRRERREHNKRQANTRTTANEQITPPPTTQQPTALHQSFHPSQQAHATQSAHAPQPTQPGGTAQGATTWAQETKNNQARHSASSANNSFASIVGWTTLGTLLPGLALIRKNQRSVVGWILLVGFLVGIAVTAAVVLGMGPIKFAARVISHPWVLDVLTAVLVLGIVIWTLVILRSYVVSSRGSRLTDAQRALAGVLVVSLILIISVPLGVGAAYSRVSSQAIGKIFGNTKDGKTGTKDQIWADKPRVNIFLIGRDNGQGRTGTRPDTMLVASIDTRTGQSTLISVPRNLNYPIFPAGTGLARRFPNGFDAYGKDSMINAVWTWSSENPDVVGDPKGLEVGMYATMQAVEGSLGLTLDYWAAVDMQGYRDLVNAMGGINIDVERPIPMGGGEDQYTHAKNKIFGWIDPGPQQLDGLKALWYVRSRDGADNYDRMCRQQRMLKTTLDQVNPAELALKFPQLANSSTRNVTTDINQSELGAFVELAGEMKNTKIKSAQINNQVTDTTQPDYDVLHAWVKKQIDPDAPSQREQVIASAQASDPSTPQPTQAADEDQGAPASATPDDRAPQNGVENSQGKCYPINYTPGDPWPGYPGPGQSGGQG